MKIVLLFSLVFCAIALPAFSELTSQDLDKIRSIIHEENAPIKVDIASIKTEIASIKTEITSLKVDVAWLRGRSEGIDKRFDTVDKQISHATNVTYGLIALIVAAVGIPQIIIAWRGRSDREQDRRIEELTREIETLKQQRIVKP